MNTSLLRKAFAVGAALAFVMAIGFLVAGPVLADWFGLPAQLLMWVGIAIVPLVLLLAYSARRPIRGLAILVIVINTLWVAGSILVAVAHWPTLTIAGIAMLMGQCVVVAVVTTVEVVAVLSRPLSPAS